MIAVVAFGSVARAADPQSYRVDMASTGDGSMDATLRATSDLLALRESAPVSPFGLIARARGEVERLKTVLESYGYYQSAVTITIEGLGLSSTGLVAALTALPKGQSAHVATTFNLGPLYHLRKVDIEGTIPEGSQGAFTLKAGDPAVAADVLAAGARLLTALQERGYAFAKVDPPAAYEDQTLPVLDVSFRVDAGARATIGEIRFEGLQRVHEKLVRRRLTLRSGQQYSPTAIEAARRDLLSLGPFAAISVDVGKAVDSTGGVPITFTLRERKRHAVTVNAAYSTDLGGSGGVTWGDRNVFGNAEQLTVAASALNLGGSATKAVGYDTSVKFLKPEFGHRDQSLQIAVGAIKQSLQAYDQKAVTSGVTLTRKLSSVWTASAGIATSNEQVIQETNTPQYNSVAPTIPLYPLVTYNYTLVALPLTLSYDSTHLASPLDDPVHGMRDSLSITPTQSLGHPNASFIISQIKLAAYFDLHALGFTDPGRSVLAARALAGEAQGAGEFSLPPDQRFYGGGSGTIRGYRYQSVGPQFPADGNPIGGTAIIAGTLEFRQRIAANWGAAAFVDGGQVSSSLKPLTNELRIGYGIGARYYTAIGPIRLDVAVPTRRHSFMTYTGVVQNQMGTVTVTPQTGVVKDDAFEIYIGLGQAF
ncbi:MAG TPA: BamA/TamA family outer membrane protein [Steroidobacteraceae bacterium]|nr:BamA/TamA family outer membrane protein [Steroidobacteraceae bacterium]